MTGYTPTTGEVREAFMEISSRGRPTPDDEIIFDRWFVGVERAAAVRALEDAADVLSSPGKVYSPLIVGMTEAEVISWLRARAAEIRGAG